MTDQSNLTVWKLYIASATDCDKHLYIYISSWHGTGNPIPLVPSHGMGQDGTWDKYFEMGWDMGLLFVGWDGTWDKVLVPVPCLGEMGRDMRLLYMGWDI